MGSRADSTGVAASIAGSCTHPLDLTKVRLQTSGDKGMLNSIKKTIGQNGQSRLSSLSLFILAILPSQLAFLRTFMLRK